MHIPLLILLTLLPAHLIDPEDPKYQKLTAGISVQNATYAATITEIERLSPEYGANKKVRLGVKNTFTADEKMIVIDSRIDIVLDLYLYQNHLILNGQEAYNHLDDLYVFDLVNGVTEVETRHDGMSFSPSRRFLIYKVGTPRHGGGVFSMNSALLIYDLAETDKSNFIDIYGNTGWILYPEEAKTKKTLSDFKYYERTSPFFWTANEDQVLFFIKEPIDPKAYSSWDWEQEHRDEKIAFENFVVKVDLSSGADNFILSKSKVGD